MHRPYQPTPTLRSLFALGITGLVLAALNVPIVMRSGSQSGAPGTPAFLDRGDFALACETTVAGFPWSHTVRYQAAQVTTAETNSTAMVGDVLVVWLILAAVAVWLVWRLQAPKQGFAGWVATHVSGGRLAAAMIAMTAVAIAVSFAIRDHGQKAAIAALPKAARWSQATVIPAHLEHRVPRFLQKPWMQVRTLELFDAEAAEVARLTPLPNLTTLKLRGGCLDDSAVERIAAMPLLRVLILRETDLSRVSTQSLTRLRSLTNLKLTNNALSPQAASAIVRLPHLRELQVAAGPATLGEISRSLAGTTLVSLTLTLLPEMTEGVVATAPRQSSRSTSEPGDTGFDASIRVERAAELETLAVRGPTASRIAVSLVDLPHLQSLKLAEGITYSLSAKRLLRWWQLESIGNRGYHDNPHDEQTGNQSPVLERVDLADVQSLQELPLHGRYIRSVSISGAPHLARIRVGNSPDGRTWGETEQESFQAEAARFRSLIEQLSQVQSLRELDLHELSLEEVNLAPLAELEQLSTLSLEGCDVSPQQVLELLAIRNLDSLSLLQTGVDQAVIARLLNSSHRWKSLRFDASSFSDLTLVNHAHLDQVPENHSQVRHVLIVNTPHLDGELRLENSVETLKVRNAPKLRSLVVAQDLPEQAELAGLNGLTVFEAGGPAVDDEIMTALAADSLRLRSLILRSSTLTRRGLAPVQELHQLDTLHLPGTPVDDELTSSWGNLKYLRDVVLDHTSIGPETVTQLAKRSNLQRLSLSYTDLAPNDLQGLKEATSLVRLDVAGVGILATTLRAIGKQNLLYQLNLDNVRIDEPLFDALASAELRSVSILHLRNSGLNDEQVMKLIRANPSLVLHAPRDEFSRGVYAELVEAERIIPSGISLRRLARLGGAAEALFESPYSGFSRESLERWDGLQRQRPRRMYNP